MQTRVVEALVHIAGQFIAALTLVTPAKASAPSVTMAPITSVGSGEDPAETIDPVRIQGALVDGLERGNVRLGPLEGACEDRACWREQARQQGYEHVVFPMLERRGPDHELRLLVVDVDGEEVASTHKTCEICGQRELISTAGDLAAMLSPRLVRLGQEGARILIDGRPRGASVEIDGVVVGTLPWEGSVEPGSHRVVVRDAEYVASERTLVADAGVRERVTIQLAPRPVVIPAPEPQPQPLEQPSRPVVPLAVGGALGGAGLVALGVGVGLFAIDGRPHRASCIGSLVDEDGDCPLLHESTRAAVTATSIGAAALVAGTVVTVVALVRHRRATRRR